MYVISLSKNCGHYLMDKKTVGDASYKLIHIHLQIWSLCLPIETAIEENIVCDISKWCTQLGILSNEVKTYTLFYQSCHSDF